MIFRDRRVLLPFFAVLALVASGSDAAAQTVRSPTEFFGFDIGTDGELARYPQVLDYLQHLAESSDRVEYEVRGTTTGGHPYVLATFTSNANLNRIARLVEINHRLTDPRGLTLEEAAALTREGVPFYFLNATIHSTEVGNGQTIINVAHRLATEDSREINEILDNAVVLLVPSQNPDGQVLVVDHWYATRNTPYDRTYPDLYHRYTGHDNNRDWFMFTQKETRMAVEIHREFKPQVTHDMHQMSAGGGARIFVPPFKDPHDPNIHPLLLEAQAEIGTAMSTALKAAGKTGVVFNDIYDQWTPARQYMVYHGQPRILTEIASARLADPIVNPDGAERPFGPQQRRRNYPAPYDSGVWRLRDIVEYGEIVVYAGLGQVAKNGTRWLANFHQVHRDWVEREGAPYAFVVPANQPDRFETYELLQILDTGEVEIHQARSEFTAGGRVYPPGSWVIDLAQPYGAFAKTMLERQDYPDLRTFPGDPPIPPYDVTAQTLGLLMGVDVDQIDEPFRADLELLTAITPERTPLPERPAWAYALSPTSNAGFKATARLQAAGVPVFRAAQAVDVGDARLPPGAWIVPPSLAAEQVLEQVANATGLIVSALEHAPSVSGYKLKAPTRVGLWRVANNMPGGWMMWLFEQYGLDHRVISSRDFAADLSDTYDVIVLPSGTTSDDIVNGLEPRRHDESWRWAHGVGASGWAKLRRWVLDGGTLVALGSAVSAARELLDLPMEPVLPSREPRQPSQTPGNRVNPTSVFYSPGSLLKQEHNPDHPVGFGMRGRWPVFFRFDQAYQLTPSFDIRAEVVSKYPDEVDMTASGWLLGDELLRDQANVVSFEVGTGTVVTMGSQITFRTQPRATFKLLFNAIFQGPATPVDAATLALLR